MAMIFINKIIKANFISRPNRFIVICRLNGDNIKAYLPNPGRLRELLFENVILYLERDNKESRKTEYTVIAVERDNFPVMLHTHRTNDIVHHLLEQGVVPGLEKIKIIQREITHGKSRFDFLIQKKNKKIFLEVKSCTLFSSSVAMFPDAVTSRGKRHLEELAELSGTSQKGIVLFLINSTDAEIFLPDFHTDPDFAETMLKVRDKISIIPLTIKWNKNMTIDYSGLRMLNIPWKLLEKEFKDSGCYFIILKLSKQKVINVGSLGEIRFKKGYYIYAGSAKKNLLKRIQRHKSTSKKLFWHIDYIRQEMDFVADLPIRTADDLECSLAKDIRNISNEEISGFGSSDCKCISHLFRMSNNPLSDKSFMEVLLFYRLERLAKKTDLFIKCNYKKDISRRGHRE